MRTIQIAAALSAVLSLAACTGGAGSPSASAPSASAPSATASASSSSGGGAAVEAKIGAVLSLTKAAAVYGKTQQNGLELAVKDVNAKGAVKIDLQIEDDASDPATGITAFQKLINQDQVAAIIGPTLSNTATSTDPIAQKAGVPVLGISNTASGITDIGDFIFRDSLTEAQVIPQTISTAKAKYSLTKVAVLYGQDDAFTKSGYDVFSQALKDGGVTVTDTETFSKGDKNFNAQLTKAIGTAPDALVVSALADEGTLILQQARQAGFTGPIIGGNGFNSPAVITNGGQAAEGLVVGAAWNQASDIPANKTFISEYTAAYGSPPDQFAAQAYAGVEILAAAIEAAGSADRTAIRDALGTVKDLDTPLGSFSFTSSRDAQAPAAVQVVQNGTFAVLK
ncbi:MAG TPA: ABC transporter substrate-binding protein [Candidatus Limnocylindrales bacterium]|nr:ABC transporter substrate-binding protein [Candidatus Limnocylindrales bacterium]